MTPNTDLQAIIERLERVERQNRTLKRAGVAALAVLGAVLFMGQALPSSRTLSADRLTIEDPETHRVLLELGTEKSGTRNYARLRFLGDDGKVSAQLNQSGIGFQYQDQSADLGFTGLSMEGRRTSVLFNHDEFSYSSKRGGQLLLLPTVDGGMDLTIASSKNEFGVLAHSDEAAAFVASPRGSAEIGADAKGTWIARRPPSP
jgi:hypothetical protein